MSLYSIFIECEFGRQTVRQKLNFNHFRNSTITVSKIQALTGRTLSAIRKKTNIHFESQFTYRPLIRAIDVMKKTTVNREKKKTRTTLYDCEYAMEQTAGVIKLNESCLWGICAASWIKKFHLFVMLLLLFSSSVARGCSLSFYNVTPFLLHAFKISFQKQL